MPDLSLFKPLCDELDITINELLSGEKIDKKDYQNKLEENIVNMVDYNDKKSDVFGYLIFTFFGLISLFVGFTYHSVDYIFPVLFELYGIFLIIYGFNKLLINIKKITRIITIIITIIIFFVILFSIIEIIDISCIGDTTPKYYYSKKEIGDCVVYNKLFKKNIVYVNNSFWSDELSSSQIEKLCKSKLLNFAEE